MMNLIAFVLVLVEISSAVTYEHVVNYHYGVNSSFVELLSKYSRMSSVKFNVTENANLSSPITFESISGLAIVGGSVDQLIEITCYNESGLAFSNVSNLILRNLKLVQCGMLVDGTSINASSNSDNFTTWKVKVALVVTASYNVTVSGVNISNSNGVGITLINSGGRVLVSNCTFRNNSIIEEYVGGGGGLHIELSACDGKIPPPVCNDSKYEIEGCTFEANNASIPDRKRTAYMNLIQPYSRGGGLFYMVTGKAVGNALFVRNCTFESNEAIWGGGIGIFINGHVIYSNVIEIFNCTLEGNRSPNYGGGGLLLQYQTNQAFHNLIHFHNCSFSRNEAVFGGGVQFIGEELNTRETLIHFENCDFFENRANASAAVDITKFSRSLSAGLNILFTSCNFTGNTVIDDSMPLQDNNMAFQVHSGIATFSVLYLDVTFNKSVSFCGNTGSALYVIAGDVHFERGTVSKFVNNSGYYGGAMVLVASSMMHIRPNSSFYFIGNTAINEGGAIFAYGIGLHQLHDFMITSCFIAECDACPGSVNFYFAGNKVGVSNDKSSTIFSNNLVGCRATCNRSPVDNDDIFSCFGNFHFCESCEEKEKNCSNCSLSRAKDHSRGLARSFMTSDSLPVPVFSGQDFNLSLEVYDDVGNSLNNSYYVAEIEDTNVAYIDPDDRYISNGRVRVSSNVTSNATLILHRIDLSDFQLRLSLAILPCPPGYSLNDYNQCSCSGMNNSDLYNGILCKRNFAKISHGKWLGYTGDVNSPENLITSLCPVGFCSYNTSNYLSSYKLPTNSADLERFVCNPTREGRVCGKCVPNASVYFHSPQLQCTPDSNCDYGALFYILSELIPITVVYVIVMAFNISFTSGLASGFIFFAQVIDTLAINANGINGLESRDPTIRFFNDAYLFIYNSFNLEFFGVESLSFCLWKGAGTLDVMIMKYVTIIYAFVLIMITVFVLRHCKLCCKRRSLSLIDNTPKQNHIIHGLSAFLISCYVQCMRVSSRILLPTHLYGLKNRRHSFSIVFYGGHLDYLKGWHLLYAIPAFLCLTVIVIVPPLALLVYPLFPKLFALCGIAESKPVRCLSVPFEKMKPFFDSFQSCYKDNFRFVAGLSFFYRALLLVSYAVSVGFGQFYVFIGILLMIIIVLHFLMQPQHSRCHNITDMLVFLNLAAINTLSLYRFGISYQNDAVSRTHIEVAGVVQLILVYLPLAVAFVWILSKLISVLKTRIGQKMNKQGVFSADDFLGDVDHSSRNYRLVRLASFN